MEKNLELTTSLFLDSNSTNDTIDESIPEISVSPQVTEVLREIFRTYEPYCRRRTYGRGVGRPLHTCPEHAPEQDGLICYPPCRDGYNGVGPVCWEECGNLTSFTFLCLDVRVSKRDSCPWYDKCGFTNSSCVLCPENYTRLGCLCGRFSFRSSYGRGVGKSLVCSKLYEQDGALCYKNCKKDYNGIGPVCWQKCPTSHPYSCFTGCSKTKDVCHGSVKEMVYSVIISSIEIIKMVIGIPLVTFKTLDIISYAEKGNWELVVQGITILSAALMEKILPELSKKFVDWSFGTLQSATRNASLILTAAALKENLLLPFLNYFHFNTVKTAFNHGKCDFN